MHKQLLCILLIVSSCLYSMDTNGLNSNEITRIATRIFGNTEELIQSLDEGFDPNTVYQLTTGVEISLMELAISVGNLATAKILFDYGANEADKASIITSDQNIYDQVILWYGSKKNDIQLTLHEQLANALMANQLSKFKALLESGATPSFAVVHLASRNKAAIKILREVMQNPHLHVIYHQNTINLIEGYYSAILRDDVHHDAGKNNSGDKDNDVIISKNTVGNKPHWSTRIISKKSIFVGLTLITLSTLGYKYLSKQLKKRAENKNQTKKQEVLNA